MSRFRYVKAEDGASLRMDKVGDVYVVELRATLGKVHKLNNGLFVAEPSRGASMNAPTLSEGARILARMHAAGWI